MKVANGRLDFSWNNRNKLSSKLKKNEKIDEFFTVFDDLDFEAYQGERIAVVGANGAGKTSFLRLIAGVYSLTQGQIEVCGRVNSLIDLYAGLNVELTGKENITRLCLLAQISLAEISNIIEEVQDFSELNNWLDKPVKTYSSGMILRLVFSVMTSIPADIILMDEWLVVGDENFQRKAQIRLEEYLFRSKLFFLATHDKRLVKSMCTRQVHFKNGSISFDSKNL